MLQAIGHLKPGHVAAAAAAMAMILVVLTGLLDACDRRLSDAWFGTADIAPSGRTVLVTFDHGAARYANTARVPRRDLADLLLKLDAAGASHILLEVALAEQSNDADDKALERVLTQLGRKVAISATAVPSRNQASWRRAAALERFARHAARAGSDLAVDNDGMLRAYGIENSGLRSLVSGPAWLSAAGTEPGVTPERGDFRIDFGVELGRIPTFDALSILQGGASPAGLSGANVIVGGYSSPTTGEFRVPRYGAVTRAQVAALGAETLALGRQLRPVPRAISDFALIGLATLMALFGAGLGARFGAGILAAVALGAIGLGLELQNSFGLIVPAASAVAAALCGFAAAQVTTHPAFGRVRHAATTLLSNIDVRLAHVLDDTADGLMTFDRQGTLLSINAAARRLLGIDGRADPGAHSLSALLGPQADGVMAVVHDNQPRRVRAIVRPNGAELHLELAVNAVAAETGSIGVATLRDVSEQHAQIEALSRIATRDPLTGLSNRRAFEAALQAACAGTTRFALFMCDLDGFKPVNDNLGHPAGDALLREIAGRLVVEAKPDGVAARLGGDEFGVLIPLGTEALAVAAAHRLVGAVALPIEIGGQSVRVGVSIGIALSSKNQDAEALMAIADAAMYDAKRSRSGYAFGRKPAGDGAAPPHAGPLETGRLFSRVG